MFKKAKKKEPLLTLPEVYDVVAEQLKVELQNLDDRFDRIERRLDHVILNNAKVRRALDAFADRVHFSGREFYDALSNIEHIDLIPAGNINYTVQEINKMSSEEYKQKVLFPQITKETELSIWNKEEYAVKKREE